MNEPQFPLRPVSGPLPIRQNDLKPNRGAVNLAATPCSGFWPFPEAHCQNPLSYCRPRAEKSLNPRWSSVSLQGVAASNC